MASEIRVKTYESVSPDAVVERLHERYPDHRHPRLLLDDEKIPVLRKRIEQEEVCSCWMQAVLKKAEDALAAPKLEYVLEDGIRLLYVSRRALDYIENQAFAYLMTGEKRYGEGAVERLMQVCGDDFPDWHPYHFLDVAEMAAAVSLGYDWCYDLLTDTQRDLVKSALVEKALKPVLEDYHEIEGRERTWYWSSRASEAYPNNWISVCFGGTVMAALVIGDEDLGEFHEVGTVITEGMEHLKDWFDCYMPDGACSDGPGYWEFAMEYNAFGIAAMHSVLGTDYGLTACPAFNNTFIWELQMEGPCGFFNYDSNTLGYVDSPEFFWHSGRIGNPVFAYHRLQKLKDGICQPTYKDILWYEHADKPSVENSEMDFTSRGSVQTTVLRGGYGKEDSWFAMLGGVMFRDPKSMQSCDGTFVLDMLGERWALDLGIEWESYVCFDVPWEQYYRYREEGHNLIVADPDVSYNYEQTARGRMISRSSDPQKGTFVYDFQEHLAHKGCTEWKRSVMLDRRTQAVVLRDRIAFQKPVEFYWFLHTAAQIRLSADRRIAQLYKNGKEIYVRLDASDEELCFEVMEAVPLPGSPNPKQTSNEGIRKLAVRKPQIVRTDLEIVFEPVENN